MYRPLASYPPESEVEYECISSEYININSTNTKLVCETLSNGETMWVGDTVDCQQVSASGI